MFDDKTADILHALRGVSHEYHGIVLRVCNDLCGPDEHVYAERYASVSSAAVAVLPGLIVQPDNIGGRVIGSAATDLQEVAEKVPTAPQVYVPEKVEIPHGAFGVLSSHATGFRFPGSDTPFIVAEHFAVDVSEAAEIKISHIDPELQDEFSRLVVPKYEPGMLVLQDTVISADDTHIMSDIGDVRLKTDPALLRFLLKNRCLTNRRYVLYMETDTARKMLRAVSLSWQRGGWSIGRRLVFRSDVCPVGTVVISRHH